MGTDEETGRPGGSTNEPTAEEVLATGPSDRGLDSALAKPPSRGGKLSSTVLLIVGVLVAVGFVGGLLLGRSTTAESGTAAPNVPGDFPDGGAPPGGTSVPNGGGFTAGTIDRIDGGTIYIQTPDGETVEIRTGGDTEVQVTAAGTVDDLAAGETVIVQGDASSDGSLDATSIVESGAALGSFGGPPTGNG